MLEKYFKTIANNIDNGIIIIDRELKVHFWNAWLEIRTNIANNKIKNKSILDFYPEINTIKLNRKISTSLKLNSSTFYANDNVLFNIELGKITNKPFKYMQQKITISPFDLDAGLVAIYIYDHTDLSEINCKVRQANNSLELNNIELSLLLDATTEAILIFKNNNLKRCNNSAVELFKFDTKDDILNKDLSYFNIDENILKNKFNTPIETKIKDKHNNYVPVLFNLKELSINNETLKVITLIDISELKRKENILVEQSKLAAMGEMLENIAHQWRQPLNQISIIASGSKFNKSIETISNEKLDKNLSQIINTTEHLSQTVDVFRDFMKNEKDKKQFNLSDNLNKSIAIIEANLNFNKIKIVKEFDNSINLFNYSNELNQAIINILSNAKDAIILNKINEEDRIIKISSLKAKNSAIITITDSAGGIPNSIKNKIFEPYFTTKHQSYGTGLGLYMTHKIICESMKGNIEVKNIEFLHNKKLYTGASFTIKLNNLD